jgi:hypothetical protein
MKKIYYEKVGKRYKPVAEYDSDWDNSLPKGAHLTVSKPGSTSRRFNIDPAYAPLIAAGMVAEDAISKAISKTLDMRLPRECRTTPLTVEQRKAWDNLIEVFGEDARRLEYASVRECAEEGVKAMITEADKLMTNPSVKKAYEQFLLLCELTKER